MWVEKSDLHDERLGASGQEYPLLCMSNHGRWRFHANCDDITWNREIETMKIRGKDGYQYEPMWIHPSEAKKRGIEHGDIVKVFNERGTVLCAAYVTERLIDRTVYVDHGSGSTPSTPRAWTGAAPSTSSPPTPSPPRPAPHGGLRLPVEVAKVTDEEMEQWKRKYPESFGRKVDEACGVCLDGCVIND